MDRSVTKSERFYPLAESGSPTSVVISARRRSFRCASMRQDDVQRLQAFNILQLQKRRAHLLSIKERELRCPVAMQRRHFTASPASFADCMLAGGAHPAITESRSSTAPLRIATVAAYAR